MIPGPRPPKGQNRPGAGRDRGMDVLRPTAPDVLVEAAVVSSTPDPVPATGTPGAVQVALVRTERGWCVQSPAGREVAGGLVEGLSLADLVSEELGVLNEPGRSARRSARGTGGAGEVLLDPAEARMAELERTVAQLEHALAARVSTERAIGVLAERRGTSARAAFETLRRDARSQGRPVAELAREVLDALPTDSPEPAGAGPTSSSPRAVPAPGLRRPHTLVVPVTPPTPRPTFDAAAVVAGDGGC
ncbi:ANTAR domain-containing protein [Blastococcus tunisiensis]|uniref:ANTAR domain-containing protein n=1 Tax=Blastococcus tunisiensis TaxID=1798228 RepID=A0A1I2CBA7_9ACTN|nr:ANTAR domain-containing protein [Blastococcus sp. DSM 46838]